MTAARQNKILFWLLCAFYAAVTCADLSLTYLATPDLALEGNPLVQVHHLGWGALCTVNVLTFIVYIAMCHYACFTYQTVYNAEKTSIKRYLSAITYDDPQAGKFGMIHRPKHWAPQIACLCFSIAVAVPFSKCIVIAEWICIYKEIPADLFFAIVQAFPLGRLDIFAAIVLAWICSFVWIFREFSFSKNKS